LIYSCSHILAFINVFFAGKMLQFNSKETIVPRQYISNSFAYSDYVSIGNQLRKWQEKVLHSSVE